MPQTASTSQALALASQMEGLLPHYRDVRQLAEHALEVQAVANLEQAVGDRVPVRQQLVVARHAEVETATDAAEGAGLRAGDGFVRQRREVEGQIALELFERGSELV